MKTTSVMLALLAAIGFLPVQAKTIEGNKKVVTRDIPVPEYDAIVVRPSTNFSSNGWRPWKSEGHPSPVFRYAQGNRASLKITMDENLFDALKIKCEAGRLEIYTDQGVQIRPSRLTLAGESKTLKNIRLTSSVDFILDSPLEGNDLEIVSTGSGDYLLKPAVRVTNMKISLTGSGDVEIGDLVCMSLEARTSGSGDISLQNGRADNAVYRCSGSGDIDADRFDVKHLDCKTSGSGDMEVRASETLIARTSGSGDIEYRGAASVDKKSTGSGDIERAD